MAIVSVRYDPYSEHQVGSLKVWDAEKMTYRPPMSLEEKVEALEELVLRMHLKLVRGARE